MKVLVFYFSLILFMGKNLLWFRYPGSTVPIEDAWEGELGRRVVAPSLSGFLISEWFLLGIHFVRNQANEMLSMSLSLRNCELSKPPWEPSSGFIIAVENGLLP